MLIKRNTEEQEIQDQKDQIIRPVEVATYEEKTIKVLGILESSGVNIYSANNFGGMYLKTKESESKRISSFFDSEDSQPTEIKQEINSSIIDFFK